jgi:PEP-CTERM motif
MKAGFFTSIFRGRRFALVALAFAVMVATTAHATTIFTSNLSNVTTPSPDPNGNQFQLNYNGGSVAGITNTSPGGVLGYNFVYQSAFKSWFNGASSNGLGSPVQLDTAVIDDAADSQDGGYFLALDSVYEVAAIDINISTIMGDVYTVSFDWAGTQQRNYMGASTDFLTVMLGASAPQTTGSLSVAQQSFTGCGVGWCSVTDTFTAGTTGTEVLSFLAGGTPVGANQDPAMTLLDNISVSQGPPTFTPEPSSLMLLSTGLLGLGGYVRWRTKNRAAQKL